MDKEKKWEKFKIDLPHRKHPYSKRNWGNGLHSLCSYQGKMKPSLVHHLINVFSKKNELPRKLPHLNASRGIKIEYNDEGIAAVNKKYNEDFKTFNYKMFNTALDEKNYNIY